MSVLHVHARRDAEHNEKPTHLKPNRSVHGFYSAASQSRRLQQAEVAKLTQRHVVTSEVQRLICTDRTVRYREAVFSPNPMRYRPIWSCDFWCNFHVKSAGSGESLLLAFSCQLPIRQSHGGPRLDSCRWD